MTIWQSLLLGAVQGITEFFPVSSSGHLAILQNIFHIDTGGSILFDVLLHLGTLAVVFIVFYKDIWKMILAFCGMVSDLFTNIGIWFSNRKAISLTPYKCVVGTNYRKFVLLVIVSSIPTAIIGFAGKKLINDASTTLIIPGICLLISGGLLLIADRTKNCTKIPQDVTYREGGLIGIAQGLATLPGLSRSGSTITACLLCGINPAFAMKYSFILSIPAILGATVLELTDIGAESLSGGLILTYLAGMIAAGLFGYLCMRIMLKLIKKRRFRYFAFYCFAIGIVAIIGHFVL